MGIVLPARRWTCGRFQKRHAAQQPLHIPAIILQQLLQLGRTFGLRGLAVTEMGKVLDRVLHELLRFERRLPPGRGK